jgi:bacterioferritin (cytochrome b1)
MTEDFLRLRDARSRRDFFRFSGLTVAGGSVVFLAACGDDDDDDEGGISNTGGDSDGGGADVQILNAALDLENTAIAAYTAGAALLKGEVLKAGKQFLGHEQEHADGLTQAIRDLGGTPNKAKSTEEYAKGFPKLGSQRDVLEFAVDLENMAVKAYLDAIPKLSSGELRQTGAAIVSNEAEHISVLLGALGMPQVPDAFVTGA